MPTPTSLDSLCDAILAEIVAGMPGFKTVAMYPREKARITTPACFVNLVEANPTGDLGTDQLNLALRFEALIVYGFTTEQAKRTVQAAAIDLARFIRGRRFGGPTGPARVESIQQDAFSPELDQYEVWRVDWTQEISVGADLWDTAGETPPSDITINEDVNPDAYRGALG